METTTATPRELNEDDLAFLERYSAFRRSQHAGGEEPSQDQERARLRQHILHLWTTCLAEVPHGRSAAKENVVSLTFLPGSHHVRLCSSALFPADQNRETFALPQRGSHHQVGP
jgi:hypothetical protein